MQLPFIDHHKRRRRSSSSTDLHADILSHYDPSSSAEASTSTAKRIHPSKRVVRRKATLLTAGLCLALACASGVAASEGDRSPEYINCVESRYKDVCGPDGVDDGMTGRPDPLIQPDPTRLPFMLRLTRWDCLDDSKYHCTHKVTNDALRKVQMLKQTVHQRVYNMPGTDKESRATLKDREKKLLEEELAKLPRVQKQMVQFHGKWVFVRIWGAQEPLSVMFSFFNYWVHFMALFKLRRQLPDVFPLKLVYIIHALISCNAWFWSAVFHTRDKPWTEKLDYFSAASVMLSGLFLAICRLFRIAPGTRAFTFVLRTTIAAFILHVLYLSFGRFDYGYNMTANVVVGLAHNLLWLLFSVRPATFAFSPASPGVAGSTAAERRSALRASKPRSPLITPSNSSASVSASASSSAASSHSEHHHPHTPPAPVVASSSVLTRNSMSSRESRRVLQLLLAAMTGAALLEVLDFPPLWRAVDAHCLWHLATVPLAHFWYIWLIEDARACVGSGWWIGEPSELLEIFHSRVDARISRNKDRVVLRAKEAMGRIDWERVNAFIRRGVRVLSEKTGVKVDDYIPLQTQQGLPGGDAGAWEREQEKAKELGSRAQV